MRRSAGISAERRQFLQAAGSLPGCVGRTARLAAGGLQEVFEFTAQVVDSGHRLTEIGH